MGNSCSCSSGVVEPELGTLGTDLLVFFIWRLLLIKLPEMSNIYDSGANSVSAKLGRINRSKIY